MSNKELMLDVGQANDLKLAMRKGGWTNDDLKQLENQDTLAGVLTVIRGTAKVEPLVSLKPIRKHRLHSSHVDLDADPFCPEGWKVISHRPGGGIQKVERRGDDLYVGGTKVVLWRSERQLGGKTVPGFELKKEWDNQPVLNANLLDFLYKEENQHLIPESWKGLFVFFPGTEYSGPNGGPGVRCLFWGGRGWDWGWRWLSYHWSERYPAASLASPL